MTGQELRRTFTLASAFKEGDLSVGGTADDQLRDEARGVLQAKSVGDIRRAPLLDDGVTASLERSRDRRFDSELDPMTIGQLKGVLLGPRAAAWVDEYRDALASEAIAAVVKVMTGDELSSLSRTLFNPLAGQGITIGHPRHFGSRIQPNSAGDDEREILFSILDGLSYGCGDVILGLNPAADDLDTIARLERLLERVVRCLELPTRYCVLSDIVKQHAARTHARVDVGFQSLAGTSRALVGMVGLDVDGVADLARDFDGLYFETGQGSEVTNGAAEGIDMGTLEARTYGVARHVCRQVAGRNRPQPWTIVNDVAGFIGPEVFRNAEQLERACLEDAAMAKLHGLTMGLDVCATFHMGIAPRELHGVTERIVERAAPAYLMAVAGNADPMLGYLTTSFRQHPALRRHAGRLMTSAMEQRLLALGAIGPGGEPRSGSETVARLYAAYARNSGDRRQASLLEEEALRQLNALRERGLDLALDGPEADARLERIYAHARRALYASLDGGVVRDASPRHVRVRTAASSRDEYLAHPPLGERLREDDAAAIARLSQPRSPQVQVVVSDGLNADAINEQLRALLPELRRLLSDAGCHVGETDVVVHNGRVRAGYEIGGLVNAAVVVHVLGERPGTGLNTASAYITYGRDEAGQPRWSRELDHSATTAICGIHPKGKPPQAAAEEIARTVTRTLDQRRSGVALKAAGS
ncbi:MAG TPA: ethanolamine ammonia-lyase subunit EutB [Vicinamibacterales bacterium]|jgi:ethanolamine ammonia-lyase large subunit